MDGNLKAWRAHKLLATLYGIGLLALAGWLWFSPQALPPRTMFLALSGLPMLCAFHALAALGARKRQNWARIASLVMGAVLLLAFPVGTIFGIYLLMASWQPWPEAYATAGAPRGGWPKDAVADRRRGGDRRGGMR